MYKKSPRGLTLTDWIYEPFNINLYTGFVYIITNKLNDKFYIGQKKFWFKKKLKPLKGRTRARKILVESDWRTYYGSCDELNKDVKKYGPGVFERKILKLCISKAQMNYYETKMQFDNRCLLRDDCYNGIINVRVTRRGL